MFTRFIMPAITLALLVASPSLVAQSVSAAATTAVPAEAPIVIDSVNNEYDLRNGLTRFYDDVSIQRGSMKVSADEGVVRQAEGEIVSIELSGSPTTWEDRLEDGSLVQGEARRIHFDVQKNVITLTDGARIRHEQGEFTGDELIYDLDTENLVGRGSADNRARVIIEPEAMRRKNKVEPAADATTESTAEVMTDAATETTPPPETATDPATDSETEPNDGDGVEVPAEPEVPIEAPIEAPVAAPIDPPDAG